MKRSIIIFTFLILSFEVFSAACIWKERISFVKIEAICPYKGIYGSYGMIDGRHIFVEWKINGIVKSNDFLGEIVADGTYDICLKLTDNELKCDTTICKTVFKKCAGGCYWKERIQHVTLNQSDSCPYMRFSGDANILNQYFTLFKWTVDGIEKNDFNFKHYFYTKVYKGTHKVCLELSDSLLNCDTSICKTMSSDCDITSIEQFFNKPYNFKLSPNPAVGLLKIESTNSESMNGSEINIFSIQGKLFNIPIFYQNDGSIILDVSNLKSGLYILNILKTDGSKLVMKFMKE